MKSQRSSVKALIGLATLSALGLLYAANASAPTEAAEAAVLTQAANKYIGSDRCKSCHNDPETGDQYTHWKEMDHAKAWETLATDKAKEIASKLGLGDPQKADQCVKCHMTAFGVDEKELQRTFKKTEGIQCEACHGPGDLHMKARMKAAMTGDKAADMSPTEIITVPAQSTCLACHNSESPTFERFCYYEAMEKIAHYRPGRDLSEVLVCGCGENCGCVNGCPDEGCAVPRKVRDAR
jgi:hypothetical protein